MAGKRTGARNPEWDWKDTGQKIAMGEKVGGILDSLRDTACIHVEQREDLASVKAFLLLLDYLGEGDEDTDEFKKFLEKAIAPMLKEVGYGRWYRDVITDLALAMAGKKRDDSKRFKVDKDDLLS